MDLMQEIIARAQANKQRIVLPEGTEERTLRAADRLVADGVAEVILIGNPAEIKCLASQYGLEHIDGAILIDPKEHEKKAEKCCVTITWLLPPHLREQNETAQYIGHSVWKLVCDLVLNK